MRTAEEVHVREIAKKAISELYNVVFNKNTKYEWFRLYNRDMIFEVLYDEELNKLFTDDELDLLRSKLLVIDY